MLNTYDIQELSGTLTTNGRTEPGNFRESCKFPVDFQGENNSGTFQGLPGVLDTLALAESCTGSRISHGTVYKCSGYFTIR